MLVPFFYVRRYNGDDYYPYGHCSSMGRWRLTWYHEHVQLVFTIFSNLKCSSQSSRGHLPAIPRSSTRSIYCYAATHISVDPIGRDTQSRTHAPPYLNLSPRHSIITVLNSTSSNFILWDLCRLSLSPNDQSLLYYYCFLLCIHKYSSTFTA